MATLCGLRLTGQPAGEVDFIRCIQPLFLAQPISKKNRTPTPAKNKLEVGFMAEHAGFDVHPPPSPAGILALKRSDGCLGRIVLGRIVLGGVGSGGRHRWRSVTGSTHSDGFAGRR
jgi:hypothetical protein